MEKIKTKQNKTEKIKTKQSKQNKQQDKTRQTASTTINANTHTHTHTHTHKIINKKAPRRNTHWCWWCIEDSQSTCPKCISCSTNRLLTDTTTCNFLQLVLCAGFALIVTIITLRYILYIILYTLYTYIYISCIPVVVAALVVVLLVVVVVVVVVVVAVVVVLLVEVAVIIKSGMFSRSNGCENR